MTLVELLLSTVILGVCLACAYPAEQALMHTYQAKTASSTLLTALQSARELALMNDQTISFSTKRDPPRGAVIHWRAFPNHLTQLIFLPSGLTNAENGTFWFCWESDKNPRWAIFINQAGRARLALPERTGRIRDGRQEMIAC